MGDESNGEGNLLAGRVDVGLDDVVFAETHHGDVADNGASAAVDVETVALAVIIGGTVTQDLLDEIDLGGGRGDVRDGTARPKNSSRNVGVNGAAPGG